MDYMPEKAPAFPESWFCLVGQVSLTLAVAYISFFAGENELKLSGVLATIFAALMVGKYAQPLVCDKAGPLKLQTSIVFEELLLMGR